jgi:hypothetical protein
MSVTDYEVGDKLDTSGSQIVLTYSSGRESSLGVNDVTWNPKNGTKLTKEATQFITVTYGELTDRISVRVSAKRDEPEKDKKDRDISTGRGIADSLTGEGGSGSSSISDEEAEAIANAASAASGGKPNVTDDQGRTWIPMDSFIAAGKKMQEDGAFEEKEVHEGLTDGDGTIYNINEVVNPPGTLVIKMEKYYGSETRITQRIITYNFNTYYCINKNSSNNSIAASYFSKERNINIERKETINTVDGSYIQEPTEEEFSPVAHTVTINGVTYSFFYQELTSSLGQQIESIEGGSLVNKSYRLSLKDVAGYLFGPSHTSGGSAIDWTKPDEEIEQQVKKLHETWDVSEHEGATTANGTYVLAGPIEYNPGD